MRHKPLKALLLTCLIAIAVSTGAYAADEHVIGAAEANRQIYIIAEDGNLWTLEDTPTLIMEDVSQVAAGHWHVLALANDGTLWAWGQNNVGQLGDGTTTDREYPVMVMDNVVNIAAGGAHSMAVTSNGTLWTWGNNTSYQLGDGTRTRRDTPVPVLENVMDMAGGNFFSIAVTRDGTLWTWGDNFRGQLGDGTATSRSTPTQIMRNVVYVAAGAERGFAITSNHELWGWGFEYTGWIGQGTATGIATAEYRIVSEPIRIMTNVKLVNAGSFLTYAITTDNNLWVWGRNRGHEPIRLLSDIAFVTGCGDLAITSTGELLHLRRVASPPPTEVQTPGTSGTPALDEDTPTTGTLPPNQMPDEAAPVTPTVSPPPAGTPSAWAIEYVQRARLLNLVPSGIDSAFTQAITRAEFAELAVILYEHLRGEITGRASFSDTDDINVQKAAYIGVVTGVGGGRFDPDALLTREQAAVMLSRLYNIFVPPVPMQVPVFADDATISSWAQVGVSTVTAVGIMGGVGGNRFAPQDVYTREQSIITIVRLLDLTQDS